MRRYTQGLFVGGYGPHAARRLRSLGHGLAPPAQRVARLVALSFTFGDWLASFVLTLGVELPIAWRLLRDEPTAPPRLLGVVVGASALTHPLLWFALPLLFGNYVTYLVTCESGIVLVEALILWRGVPVARPKKALVTALVMNAASLAAGLLAGALDAWVSQ